MKNDLFEIDVDSTASGNYPAQSGVTPPAISLENMYGMCLIVKSLAAQTGTLKLQVSNDSMKTLTQTPALATWVDLASGSFAIAGAATQQGNFDAQYWRWLRINWTRTGGAGVIQVFFNLKGA